MLRPFLFVGVGGSGDKTLRALKQTLQHRLEQLNWKSGIPGAWQFVQVDVQPDGANFPAPILPDADVVDLFHPERSYSDVVQSLEQSFATPEERIEALAGWCSAPLAIPINRHPGMVRNIYRTLAAAQLKDIQDRLSVKVAALTNEQCLQELRALSNALGFDAWEQEALPDPVVVTVASMVGGTGSGLFIDVIEVLKSLDRSATWLQNQVALLYTSEVFEGLPEGMRSQMPMNALGVMNELLAGLWANEVSRASRTLFEASGLPIAREHPNGTVGPAGTYLIGAQTTRGSDMTDGASAAGFTEKFIAVGEALSGLVTHPEIDFTQSFYEDVFVRSGLATSLSDKTGLRRSGEVSERMPFAAFGVSRLTLGMDYLLDYAADGLAKDQIRTMLFPQFEPINPLNPLSAHERINQLVTDLHEDFIRDCPLFCDYLPTLIASLHEKGAESGQQNAKISTKNLQRDLVNFTAQWVANVGFHVVARLLRVLSDDFQEALTMLPTPESHVNGNVPTPSTDLINAVLQPLIEHCELAAFVLRNEINPESEGTTNPIFSQLADIGKDRITGQVAPRYKPRQGQPTLIDPDSFPKEFADLMKMDLADIDQENWAEFARTRSMQGVPLRNNDLRNFTRSQQCLIEIDTYWSPEDYPTSGDALFRAAQLELRIPKRIDEIVEHTRRWLQDTSSTFGRQYRMSIKDYCNGGSEHDQALRQQAFVRAFEELIPLSDPHIKIDGKAVQAFHETPNPQSMSQETQLHLTAIPFAEQSPVGQKCVAVLQREGRDASQVDFDAASAANELYAFGVLNSAMSPLVFSSLIQPIADGWSSSSINPMSRYGFWSGRRARPLAESLPLAPEIRLSMIVGWFVGSFFQQRTAQVTDMDMGTKVEIWDPQFGWLGFPYPLLPKSPNDDFWLPSVLQSLSLAMVEAGVRGDELPLLAYRRLRNLGREVTAHPSLGIDAWDGTPMSSMVNDWIQHGVLPDGAPLPTAINEEVEKSEGCRGAALLSRVKRNREGYRQLWREVRTKDPTNPRSWVATPEIFEIRNDLDQALQILAEYVQRNAVESALSGIDG